jgi:hypothetical protein
MSQPDITPEAAGSLSAREVAVLHRLAQAPVFKALASLAALRPGPSPAAAPGGGRE